ncbi:MAG: DUF4268 domain-containing protein [Bacteroidetes bacterium]|nr:DUF4268 domain-containing protein [Bacteroidota bacterium]
MSLGELKKLDLRKQWPHEALDFTKWLAKEENIQILADELEISVEEIKVEEATGRYNADIVAKEANTGRVIIIENQLETTDHKHLGQILTYASAHDASIIVWVVKDYTEEHKQAIDWFNRNMPETISFFLAQLELWQINDSLPAPKFNIISEPNNWAKTIKQAGRIEKGSPSELKLLQQRFWSEFKEFVNKEKPQTILNLGRTPRPQHWFDISIGSSKVNLSLTFNSKQEQVGCELYIRKDANLYERLKAQKEIIEAEIGYSLDWMDLPESAAFRVTLSKKGDPTNEDKWPEYHSWLKLTAEKFQKAFKGKV